MSEELFGTRDIELAKYEKDLLARLKSVAKRQCVYGRCDFCECNNFKQHIEDLVNKMEGIER